MKNDIIGLLATYFFFYIIYSTLICDQIGYGSWWSSGWGRIIGTFLLISALLVFVGISSLLGNGCGGSRYRYDAYDEHFGF